MALLKNFTGWVVGGGWIPARWRRTVAERLVGVTFGVFSDITAQATDEAFLHRCLGTKESPDDVLVHHGVERDLPRYTTETADSHRERLLDAWNLWKDAGTTEGIIAQFASAGMENVQIRFNLSAGGDATRDIPDYPDQVDWPSQFDVYISYTGTLGTGAIASPTASDQTPSTIVSQDYVSVAQDIINRFKPVDWICREIIFDNSVTSDTFPALPNAKDLVRNGDYGRFVYGGFGHTYGATY